MNPDTSLMSMTADSTLPENMTNVLSAPTTAVLPPGGLAADALGGDQKTEVEAATTLATLLNPENVIEAAPQPATMAAPLPAPLPTAPPTTNDITSSVNPLLGLPQLPSGFNMSCGPNPFLFVNKMAGMDPRLSYNPPLAALMRQYEMISQNSKFKPVPIGADLEVETTKRRNKEPVLSPTQDNGNVKPAGPMQQILQMPNRGVPVSAGMMLNDPNMFNFGVPMSTYGWPMLPYPNPFTPNFLPCFAYPPQLSLLQNQLAIHQQAQAAAPPATQPVPATAGKKRKAPTAKSQAKRAKEIGTVVVD